MAPDMGTVATEQIGTALFGKTQRALLALFFMRPDEAFYLRQVVRMAGVGQGAVQRELARWVAAGLLTRSRRGRHIYYQANPANPVFEELTAVTVKTAGLAEVVREALATLSDRITVAFVHGSMARGTAKAGSDVDLLVIGEAGFGDLVTALQPAQATIGREVNPAVYSEREFRAKLKAGHPFLTEVMDAPRVFVAGDEHELERLAEGALAD